MQNIQVLDIGLMDYQQAWDYQAELVDSIQAIKLRNRQEGRSDATPNYFILCEHPHVYTLGKSGSASHLLWNDDEREKNKIAFVKTNRGGDITYHGPGQVVGYPVLDLEHFFTDLHRYLRNLEAVIIHTLADFGIEGARYDGYTGVWLEPGNPAKARKICAMGVKCSRWITMHGFALNVNPELRYFEGIVPCGISDKAVTSFEQELGYIPEHATIKERLIHHFGQTFNGHMIHPSTQQKPN